MPAPPVPIDLGQGFNTEETIQKLLEVARQPIERIEQQNQLNQLRIEAWEGVRTRTLTLQRKSQQLHSFAGSFALQSVVSSDPGAITGEATPNVKPGTQEIQVNQLASAHQIHSEAISKDRELPAASFVILTGDERVSVDFSGGTARKLIEQLESKGEELFGTTAVRLNENETMISLRAKNTGAENGFRFEDPQGLLESIGLVTRDANRSEPPREITLRQSQIQGEDGATAFRVTNNVLRVEDSARYRIEESMAAGDTLRFSARHIATLNESTAGESNNQQATTEESDLQNEETENPALATRTERVEMGPRISVQVGDVELEARNPARVREVPIEAEEQATDPAREEVAPDDSAEQPSNDDAASERALGIGFVYQDASGQEQRAERVITLGDEFQEGRLELQDITGGSDATGVYFFSPSGHVEVTNLMLAPATSAEGALVAKHETTPAQDAVLDINGIEVRRSQNNALTDIMDGVSLNLNRPTSGPVTVDVQVRSDDIVEEIQAWVEAHNDLIGFCRELARPGHDSRYGGQRPGEENTDEVPGVFATDSTVRQLMTRLRTMVSNPYPAITDPSYRVLADVGISNGSLGSTLSEDGRRGMLVLDEGKLRQALAENPEAVRALFVSDTNSDALPDNGVAYSMEQTLKSYTTGAGGIIAERQQMLRDRISQNKDEIRRRELSLQAQEDRLRQQFSGMQRAVNQHRRTGEYLNRNLPRGN